MNSSSPLRRLFAVPVLGLALVLAHGAHAADTSFTPAPAPSVQLDDFALGKKAVEAKNWKAASDSFARAAAKDPRNADAFNMLGYSLRWQNRYEEAFAAYDKALALDPNHKGALSYSGIGYLKAGRRSDAEARLARLQALCATCVETAELSKALAAAPVAAK